MGQTDNKMADIGLQRLGRVFAFENLEKPVQGHLKKVYSALAICMLTAAVGAYIHLSFGLMKANFLILLGSIGLIVMLGMTPHTRENETKRLGFLVSFAGLTGLGLGPLLDVAIQIDPSIVPLALMSTFVIFICFTMSALLSNQKQYLFLGGLLFNGLSLLLLMSVANLFLGIQIAHKAILILGLVIMCGFILYDTQLIIEKRRMGDDDYIWHCVDLFIDFVNLFRRILILLANKENEDRRKRR